MRKTRKSCSRSSQCIVDPVFGHSEEICTEIEILKDRADKLENGKILVPEIQKITRLLFAAGGTVATLQKQMRSIIDTQAELLRRLKKLEARLSK